MVRTYKNWLWIALFIAILLGGIGYISQAFLPMPPFEKACSIVLGIFMIVGSGFGILHNLFGEKKAEEICTWIYGILLAGCCIGIFGTLIVSGIVNLIKVI